MIWPAVFFLLVGVTCHVVSRSIDRAFGLHRKIVATKRLGRLGEVGCFLRLKKVDRLIPPPPLQESLYCRVERVPAGRLSHAVESVARTRHSCDAFATTSVDRTVHSGRWRWRCRCNAVVEIGDEEIAIEGY